MKKLVKALFVIILLFTIWIGIDRYINITPYLAEGYTTMVQIDDSVWTNIPNGKWFQIDTKVFKPLNSTQYVEHFNPILRTWKNVCGADYTYQYSAESGQPFTLHIFERSVNFEHDFLLRDELLQKETVDDINVSYGVYNDRSYVVKYVNNECEVIVITNKANLDSLKPTFKDIFNQLQK